MKKVKNFFIGLWYKLISVKSPLQENYNFTTDIDVQQNQEFEVFILSIIEEEINREIESMLLPLGITMADISESRLKELRDASYSKGKIKQDELE